MYRVCLLSSTLFFFSLKLLGMSIHSRTEPQCRSNSWERRKTERHSEKRVASLSCVNNSANFKCLLQMIAHLQFHSAPAVYNIFTSLNTGYTLQWVTLITVHIYWLYFNIICFDNFSAQKAAWRIWRNYRVKMNTIPLEGVAITKTVWTKPEAHIRLHRLYTTIYRLYVFDRGF